MDNKHAEIDRLLESIYRKVSLRDIFEQRLYELKISQTYAEKMIGVGHRTLDGLLDGKQKRINFNALKNVSTFLNMSVEEITDIHFNQLHDNIGVSNESSSKKKFIKENFDLTVLRKAGFIDTITDFDKIEQKIVSHFNLNSIFDYKKRTFSTAFWAGISPSKSLIKNAMARDFWLNSVRKIASKLDNQNYYDRNELIKFFPQIRQNSMNLEFGLLNVTKILYKLGVTVIFQSNLSTLHLRGATFAVNEKPCIALTDYKGFYPTLWHCLIHELYHVLFDFEEIKKNSYHISDDPQESLTISENEYEADRFAKRYLFPDEKLVEIMPYIKDESFIRKYASDNNIHTSIIHSYYAYEKQGVDRLAWVRARRHMPEIKKSIYRLEFKLNDLRPVDDIIKRKKLEIYN